MACSNPWNGWRWPGVTWRAVAGSVYARLGADAGVIVKAAVQGELDLDDGDTADALADKARLMTALDTINQRFGKGTMKTALIGFTPKQHLAMAA
jgi:hypothetical protein